MAELFKEFLSDDKYSWIQVNLQHMLNGDWNSISTENVGMQGDIININFDDIQQTQWGGVIPTELVELVKRLLPRKHAGYARSIVTKIGVLTTSAVTEIWDVRTEILKSRVKLQQPVLRQTVEQQAKILISNGMLLQAGGNGFVDVPMSYSQWAALPKKHRTNKINACLKRFNNVDRVPKGGFYLPAIGQHLRSYIVSHSTLKCRVEEATVVAYTSNSKKPYRVENSNATCRTNCSMEALEGRLVLQNGLTTEEHGLTNTIIHKVFQAKPLTDKQQQMLDTRRDNGEPIPAPSKYKAYKGGVTQVLRKGVNTMVDVLYEDLDEETNTLQELLPDIVFHNSVRRSHHIKGLLTLAKGMDKSLKSKSKMTTKACLVRRKRPIAKAAPYHKRTRSALKQPNTEATKSTVADFTGTWANNIGSHWSWSRTGIFFLMGPSPQQPPGMPTGPAGPGLPTGDSTGDYD